MRPAVLIRRRALALAAVLVLGPALTGCAQDSGSGVPAGEQADAWRFPTPSASGAAAPEPADPANDPAAEAERELAGQSEEFDPESYDPEGDSPPPTETAPPKPTAAG